MELNKDNMKKIMWLIVFTVLVLAAVIKLESVLQFLVLLFNIIFPFALGGAIAFIINMPLRFIERNLFQRWKWKEKKGVKKIARPVSLVLALILILTVVAVVLFVVVPQLGDTIMRLSADISDFVPKAQAWAMKLFDDNPQIVQWFNTLEINWEKLVQGSVEFLKNGASNLIGSTFVVAKTIVSAAANFVIALVFAVYIVLQKEKLSVQITKIMYAFLPERLVERTLKICTLSNRIFSHFLTGQCLEAVILGSMFFVTMLIFRFPYALLVGILIAFTALIPIFGAFIGCVVGTFLILMENPMQAVAFVIMFLVLQQIEGNLVYPHVVGNSVGLPSIWVLVAVTLGGSLMGIVGMLVFIPLVSVFYTLLREFVYKRLKRKKLLEKAERRKLE